MNPQETDQPAESLHVGRPNVGGREAFFQRANAMFDRNWLTNRGPLVMELEQRIADYLGVAHCVLTCNGTAALEIAARAAGVEGEVIMPSLTFVATAHAMHWTGLTPVFCDIDPITWNLDPAAVEALITPRTGAILGVHLYGRPCDVAALQRIADAHGLQLLFDAAHAFGCSHHGRMIGTFGDCETFSFHATKFFNCFEGGAITTQDPALADRIRLMVNFGFQGFDNVISLGVNAKMPEICAAMGLTNLDALDRFVEVNRANYHQYLAEIDEIAGLKLIRYDERERCNYQYIIVDVGPGYPLSRDDLVARLHEHGILARKYFWPGCHRMSPYRERPGPLPDPLIHTEQVAQRLLALPTGTAMDEQSVKRVLSVITLH